MRFDVLVGFFGVWCFVVSSTMAQEATSSTKTVDAPTSAAVSTTRAEAAGSTTALSASATPVASHGENMQTTRTFASVAQIIGVPSSVQSTVQRDDRPTSASSAKVQAPAPLQSAGGTTTTALTVMPPASSTAKAAPAANPSAKPASTPAIADKSSSASTTSVPVAVKPSVAVRDGKVWINQATEDELIAVLGIDYQRAHSIVLYRKIVNPLRDLGDLMKIQGITEDQALRLREKIVFELPVSPNPAVTPALANPAPVAK